MSSRNKKREPDTSNINEDEEKEAYSSDTTKKRNKTGSIRGIPLTLNVQSENEDNSIALLVDNFAISTHQAKIVLKACRKLQPEDLAIFVSFHDAPRIHQALLLPGPGRPCQPGNAAIESFNALKTWVQSKLPTGNQTKALLISGGANAVAFGNLSQAEYNAIIPTLIHLPNDFTWAAGIRTQGLSCGAMLCMTGTGVAKLPSTIFFDD